MVELYIDIKNEIGAPYKLVVDGLVVAEKENRFDAIEKLDFSSLEDKEGQDITIIFTGNDLELKRTSNKIIGIGDDNGVKFIKLQTML